MVRTRLLLRFVCTLIAALAIALPVALGPMMGAAIRLAGGEPEHTCLCGMKAGECGCSECIALEKTRTADRHASVPMLRSSCMDDEAVITGPALPFADEIVLVRVLDAPRGERISILAPPSLYEQTTRAPPTPPPRG